MKPIDVNLHCPQCPPNRKHNADKRYLLNPTAPVTRKDWRHRRKDIHTTS